jgi:hypothetical protein
MPFLIIGLVILFFGAVYVIGTYNVSIAGKAGRASIPNSSDATI